MQPVAMSTCQAMRVPRRGSKWQCGDRACPKRARAQQAAGQTRLHRRRPRSVLHRTWWEPRSSFLVLSGWFCCLRFTSYVFRSHMELPNLTVFALHNDLMLCVSTHIRQQIHFKIVFF